MYKNSHLTTLLFTTLVAAGAAQAQNLTLTAAEVGNFLVADCSSVSPKYNNYPVLSVNPTTGLKTLVTAVPGRCISQIQLFVKNIGAFPSGEVTLTDTMLNNEPKGATILNGGINGGLSFTQNGYVCNIDSYMSSVTCKHPALAPNEEADLTLNVLMEDFYDRPGGGARVGLNNTATVSGGIDTDPTDNSRFDSITFLAPLKDGLPFNPPVLRELFTVHSVPEGKQVLVDGVVITTPHTFAYEGDSLFLWHTIEGNNSAPLFLNPTFDHFVLGGGIFTNSYIIGSNMFGGGPIVFVGSPQDIPSFSAYAAATAIYR